MLNLTVSQSCIWAGKGYQKTNCTKKSVTVSFQLTETSARYARKISGTTALQEALKEKQQHIEQLLAERDLERHEVAKATSHMGEVQQEMAQLRTGQDQVRRRRMQFVGKVL